MATRKSDELTGSDGESNAKAPDNLPEVEAPSISPAESEPVAIEESAIVPRPEPEVEAAKSEPKLEANSDAQAESQSMFALVPVVPAAAHEDIERPKTAPRFAFKARHMRYARLAASVAIGATLGAIFGALATGGFNKTAPVSVATLEENKAMQQSVAKLAKEVTALKANLEAANKAAQSQVAKTGERLKQASAEITGSISAPQTVAATPSPAVAAPLPMPRPAPRIAAAESQPARPPVVHGWSIRGARAGYVYVEGHGEVYEIVPGVPLPGLGTVESIKRLDGRWVVTTPKGIIVSMRDRRYFE